MKKRDKKERKKIKGGEGDRLPRVPLGTGISPYGRLPRQSTGRALRPAQHRAFLGPTGEVAAAARATGLGIPASKACPRPSGREPGPAGWPDPFHKRVAGRGPRRLRLAHRDPPVPDRTSGGQRERAVVRREAAIRLAAALRQLPPRGDGLRLLAGTRPAALSGLSGLRRQTGPGAPGLAAGMHRPDRWRPGSFSARTFQHLSRAPCPPALTGLTPWPLILPPHLRPRVRLPRPLLSSPSSVAVFPLGGNVAMTKP